MLPSHLTFIDVETTGTSPLRDRIIEIGILRVEGSKLVESFSSLINPECSLPLEITTLTGIQPEQLESAPRFETVKKTIKELLTNSIFVAHNARFDYTFLRSEFMRIDETFKAKTLCTVRLSKKLFPRYRHDKQVKNLLHEIASSQSLCKKLLSIEKTLGKCFGTQLKTCFGACCEKELPAKYNLRFIEAFRKTKIREWPFTEPIVVSEGKTAYIISH